LAGSPALQSKEIRNIIKIRESKTEAVTLENNSEIRRVKYDLSQDCRLKGRSDEKEYNPTIELIEFFN
jgi:hypothetical protein